MSERNLAADSVHPGKLLREDILPVRAMSKTAVTDALHLIVYRQTLHGMLNEKQPITTAGMAVRLGKLLDNNGDFLVNMHYNQGPARTGRTVDVSEIPALKPGRLSGSGAQQAERP